MTKDDELRPLPELLPGWSPRRCADNARAGHIPGALKLGNQWFGRARDLVARPNSAPSLEDAAAELRKHGLG